MSDNGKVQFGFRIEIVVEPDEDGFHAYCPALKGLHTCGDTREKAFQNVKDAATAYLQSSIEHGDPIPVGIVVCKDIREDSSIATARDTIHYTEDLKVACAI